MTEDQLREAVGLLARFYRVKAYFTERREIQQVLAREYGVVVDYPVTDPDGGKAA